MNKAGNNFGNLLLMYETITDNYVLLLLDVLIDIYSLEFDKPVIRGFT